jgi:hypothetical protein
MNLIDYDLKNGCSFNPIRSKSMLGWPSWH